MPSPPSGTVTFLFTDIEGSTKLWEKNPPAMQAALARHDELLRRAIEEHGGYVFKSLSRYEEAERVYGDAVAALDEAISLAPDFTYAYYKRGTALSLQGDMLASISRFEDAQRAFSDAVAAYDEELSRVPDDAGVHLMKALALVNQGRLLQILDGQKHVVRALWEAAQSHAEQAITLVPQLEQAVLLRAEIRDLLDTLDDSSEGV